MLIPKKIFTYWHTEILTDFAKACIATWRKFNPSYEIFIYCLKTFEDDIGCDNIPKNFYSLSLQHQSNFVRVYLIYKYGGFWIDATTILTGSIDKYLENTCLQGWSTDWNEYVLENWFFCAQRHDDFIYEWKKEYTRAIELGIDNYIKDFYNYMDDVRRSGKISEQEYDYNINSIKKLLPRLFMYACYIRTDIENKYKVILTPSMKGPFKYMTETKGDWYKAAYTLADKSLDDIYNAKDSTIIKIIGLTRGNLEGLLQSDRNIKKGSIIDVYIMPYYRNVCIITCQLLSTDYQDRINAVYNNLCDCRVIVVLNITLNDFEIHDDTDIYGYDDKSYNNDNLIKNLPLMLINNKYIFVLHNGTYYYKSTNNMKFAQFSSKRKLHKLKDDVMEFIEKYKNIINIYVLRSDTDANLSYYMDFIKRQFYYYNIVNLNIKKIT